MLPLIETKEKSFKEIDELRNVISSQKRKYHDLSSSNISVGKDGILRAGRFEGPMTRTALLGTLKSFRVPVNFARDISTDLLVTMLNTLAREREIRLVLQIVDDVATAVMPADRLPINHEFLLEWLELIHPIKEAIIGTDFLRITAVTDEKNELLPNDIFGYGWELINSEDGWHSTKVSSFVIRQICSNGMVGFDKTSSFNRGYSSGEPPIKSLKKITNFIKNKIKYPDLESAINWADKRTLGNDHQLIVDYLSKKLEGDVTKQALGEITPQDSWYDMLNAVTALGRLHRLEMRRRYELEGGVLLNWFLRQGRGKPPWRKFVCDVCDYWQN